MLSSRQRWWLEHNGFAHCLAEFEKLEPKEIFELTRRSREKPGDLLRCGKCSRVFRRNELSETYLCTRCQKKNEFQNHPTWQSLKLIHQAIDYLLQCDPSHICNSKWKDAIIELGDSPVWKTVPKE